MGFIDFLFGKKPAASKQETLPTARFDSWKEPMVAEPSSEWERRLKQFAVKSANTLQDAGVPLFRSEYPRGGSGTYRDAFWLIALDVSWATRSWVKNDLGITADRSPGDPPVARSGEFVGHIQGKGLVLSKAGILCQADIHAFIHGNGHINGSKMDAIVKNFDASLRSFRNLDWGWNNRGRWRRDPKEDIWLHGVEVHNNSIRFRARYVEGKQSLENGRGTSAALSRFVKSGGGTCWPRGFISFDYD